MGGIGIEAGHRTGQVEWNSGEFLPDLERFGSRCVMGGSHVVQAGLWQFWVHPGLFWLGASLFLEILRFVLGREPGRCRSDFWFPHHLAL